MGTSKKIDPARAAKLGVKTASIASRKLPATRNADGSVKERDKTGGKAARDAKAKADAKAAKPAKKKAADKKPGLKPAARKAAARKALPTTAQLKAQKKAEAKPGTELTVRYGSTVVGKVPGPDADATEEKPAAKSEAGNGAAPASLPQVAAAGAVKPVKPVKPEVLGPAVTVELPTTFLNAALAIASKEDIRHYLNAVYLHQLDDQTLRIVATDGNRMFVASLLQEAAVDWLREGVLVPRESLERILKFVGRKAEAVAVSFGINHRALSIAEIGGIGVFTVVPVDGDYPQYQRVVDGAAAVFTQEREEMSMTTLDSAYVRSATAVASILGTGSIMPFISTDGSCPSVFAFQAVPEALLYIMAQKNVAEVLPAATTRLFGKEAMAATLSQLEAQIKKTRANAKDAKHKKFAEQFTAKADRLQAKADQLRAALSIKLEAPKAETVPEKQPEIIVKGVEGTVH